MRIPTKQEWVESLRSGKFIQTTGYLHRQLGSKYTKNCCLGVLCRVGELDRRKTDREDIHEFRNHEDESFFSCDLPDMFRRAFGLSLKDHETLIDMNDVQHKSFSEIADFIEKNVVLIPGRSD